MIEMYLGLNIFIFLLRGSGTSRISPETAFATAIKFISVVTFIAESATAFPIATATQNYEKKDHQIVLRPESDHRCIADFVPDDTDPKTERLPSINLNPPCNVFSNHPKASKNKDVERTNFQHTLKTIIDTTFTGVKEKISRTIKCPSPAASGYINEIAEKNKFSEDFNKIISSAEFKAENLGLVAWFFYSKISRFIDLKFDSIALDEVRIRQIIFRIWPGSNSSRKSRRSYPSPGKIDTINKDGSEISVPADEALGVGNHIYRNLNHRNQGGHYIGVPLAISPLGKRSLTNNIKSPLRARDNSAASDTNSVKLDEDLSSDSSDATKNEEDSLKAPVKDVKIPVDVPPAQQSRIELDKHQKNTDSSEKTEGHMLNVRSIFKHVFGETLARTLPLMAVNALGLGPLMGSGARMHGHFDNSNMGYGYGGGVGGGMHTYDDDYGDDDFGMGGGLSGAYGGGLSGGYGGGLSGGYGGGLSSGYGGGLSGVYGGGLSGGYGGGLSGVYGGGLSGGYGGGLSGGYGGRYGSTLGGGVGGGLGRGLGGGKSGGYRGSLGAEDGRGGRGQTRGYGRNVGPSHNLPNNHLNLVDEINYDPPDEDYDKAPAQDSNEDLSEENFDEKPADEYHDSEFDGRGPKKNSGAGPGRKPNSKPRPKPRPIRKFSDDESKIRLKSDSLPNTTTDPAKESDIDMEGSSTSFEEPEDNHEKN